MSVHGGEIPASREKVSYRWMFFHFSLHSEGNYVMSVSRRAAGPDELSVSIEIIVVVINVL